MKRFLNSFFIIVLTSIIFSGCLYNRVNGVSISKLHDETKERVKYKVFIDDSVTVKKQNEMMGETITLLKRGIKIPSTFKLVENYEKNYKINKKASFFELKSNKYVMLSDNLDFSDFKNLFKYIKEVSDEESIIKYNFIMEDGKLISTKKYNDYVQLIKDLSEIAYFQKTKEAAILEEKYGSSKFIIDGNEMINNKRIVLIPLTTYFSVKEKVVSQLKTYGFTIVNREEDANEVIKLEVVAFTDYKNLDKMKFQSALINEEYKGLTNNLDTTAKVSNLAMDVSKTLGAGSNTSAGIGLGLFLLDLIPNNELKKSIAMIIFVKKKQGNEVVLLKIKPLFLANYNSYQILMKQPIKDGQYEPIFEHISDAIKHFIEDGKSWNKKNILVRF